MISLLIFTGLLAANGQVSKTNLYRKPAEPTAITETAAPSPSLPVPRKRARSTESVSGNLPVEYRTNLLSQYRATESPVVLPSSVRRPVFRGLPVGEVVEAEVTGNLIAFPDSKTPVRAIVRSGKLKGSIFLGEAALEKNSKRLTIEFKRFRPMNEDSGYSFVGNGLSEDGSLGLEGKYHSGEVKYFSAEFLAAFAAGYADSLVERSTTAFGQTIEAPSVGNASRRATANAMSRTADRFAEKVRQASEFVTVDGPVSIRILVQQQPTQEVAP